jgi:hypothetical protein
MAAPVTPDQPEEAMSDESQVVGLAGSMEDAAETIQKGLKAIDRALRETLFSPNVSDSNMEAANIVDALDSVANAIRYGLKGLGTGDAATRMGGLEAHGLAIKDSADQIASAIRDLAEAVREHHAP